MVTYASPEEPNDETLVPAVRVHHLRSITRKSESGDGDWDEYRPRQWQPEVSSFGTVLTRLSLREGSYLLARMIGIRLEAVLDF